MSPIRREERRRYPPNWRQISNDIRFGRARDRCECLGECGTGHDGRCPAMHLQAHPRTGSRVILTVAHLDHAPENCDYANLRAMCQRCHLSYDAEHHASTRTRSRVARETEGMESLLGLLA